MRRRDMIAGSSAALLATPAVASESTKIPDQLPDGARAIARFVNLPDKRRMLRLTDRPPNYASPINVFTDIVTPNDRFFVRYHFDNEPPAIDMDGWSLLVSGDAVKKPMTLRMSDLLDMSTNQVLAVCQCAGNRRGLSDPHVAGVQWTDGGMGCAVWRGPSLRDVLKAAGVKTEALEVWFGGADTPSVTGMPPYRKSLPIEKAMDADTIVALAMNDAPLPLPNGYPIRLVVPGWAGTYWMKHLTTIGVSTRKLENFWMQDAYRVPAGLFPVDKPFQSQADATTVPVTELVVGSVIAKPLEGDEVDRSGFTINGVAWDRGAGIDRVEISLDGGRSWLVALLDRPFGRYAYRAFSLQTGSMRRGVYQLMSRATSKTGEIQAQKLKVNPGGYYNNVPRPIVVTAT